MSDIHKRHAVKGLALVMKDGMDDPSYQRSRLAAEPAPSLHPSSSGIRVNSEYFNNALESRIMTAEHEYAVWTFMGNTLSRIFHEAYGPNKNVISTEAVKDARGVFLHNALHDVNEWLADTGKNTASNRRKYRGIIQDLSWVRIGNLKP